MEDPEFLAYLEMLVEIMGMFQEAEAEILHAISLNRRPPRLLPGLSMRRLSPMNKYRVLDFSQFWRRIGRMKETFRMWRLICYFNKNQHRLITWDNKEIQNDSKVPLPQFMQKLIQVLMQAREPRVFRSALTSSFAGERHRKKFGEIIPGDKNLQEQQQKGMELLFADAQLRIDSCISAKFIEEDEETKALIFLPLKGKKFSTIYGLVKEWILEDIGKLWTVVSVIIIWAFREVIPFLWNYFQGE